MQNGANKQCYSQISALGGLGSGAWVLGSSFMHNVYSIFDYGSSGPASGGNKAAASPTAVAGGRRLRQDGEVAVGVPRVGLGQLTPAEQAEQAAAFQRGLAAKSSADIVRVGGQCLLQRLAVVTVLLLAWTL